MKDTLPIRCLVEALQDVIEAEHEEREARDRYTEGGGYSWGYHGQSYIEAREKAAEAFGKRLDEYIDARIYQRCHNQGGEQ